MGIWYSACNSDLTSSSKFSLSLRALSFSFSRPFNRSLRPCITSCNFETETVDSFSVRDNFSRISANCSFSWELNSQKQWDKLEKWRLSTFWLCNFLHLNMLKIPFYCNRSSRNFCGQCATNFRFWMPPLDVEVWVPDRRSHITTRFSVICHIYSPSAL